MAEDFSQFEQRKQDHIKLALLEDNQAAECNVLDQIMLQHEALPELDFDQISIKSHRFGASIEKPFLISSMTAGHEGALNINQRLMEACQASDWAMGVGSQRRELSDPKASLPWKMLRREFPKVILFSNLGIAQLIEASLAQIQRLAENIEAQAMIIHCNPLQEAIQPEGTPNFKQSLNALEQLIKQLAMPVVVKETGCGFSHSTLERLNGIGVAAVDISGLGGTHWGRIEGGRAPVGSIKNKAAYTFRNWGIDTVSSIQAAVSLKPSFEVWGSGGVRDGLDAAKLFALGVSSVGFAKPMLQAALQSAEQVYQLMLGIEYELKVAMFCTGSAALEELKEKLCR